MNCVCEKNSLFVIENSTLFDVAQHFKDHKHHVFIIGYS